MHAIVNFSAKGEPELDLKTIRDAYGEHQDWTTINEGYNYRRADGKGFEFVEAAKETWSIFYFERVSDSKTKIAIVGLGYTDSEQSKKMRAFFKPANKYSMDQLKAALEKKNDD